MSNHDINIRGLVAKIPTKIREAQKDTQDIGDNKTDGIILLNKIKITNHGWMLTFEKLDWRKIFCLSVFLVFYHQ
jgi:hypothetical protein